MEPGPQQDLPANGAALDTEIQAEQAAIDCAYARLESMRSAAIGVVSHHRELSEVGSSQSRVEWESLLALTDQRLQHLEIGESSLCFGRLDRQDGETFQIGRLSVLDDAGDPLVVDWRARAAEPFYRATGHSPMGLVRRRHLVTRGRTVIGLDDEVFDLRRASEGRLQIVGEGALMASLDRSRTGRMGDIVATIQAEQDQIIRAPLPGILIVQGGPGTGKTAVALHRAAYLLFANRQRLEDSGVLVLGPNRTFLRYIEAVLPSLGESGVEMGTLDRLYRGAIAWGAETDPIERVKGGVAMVEVIRNAIEDRERPMAANLEVPYGSVVLRVPRADLVHMVDQIQRRAGTHNELASAFVKTLRRRLWKAYLQILERRGTETADPPADLLGAGTDESGAAERETDSEVIELFGAGRELTALRREREEERFRSSILGVAEVRAAIERMWPVLTAEQLLHDLFGARSLLALATRGVLADTDAKLLYRPRSASVAEVRWSSADLALLDEAATQLGHVPLRHRRRHNRLRDETKWLIEETIDDVTLNTGDLDPEMRRALIERITDREQALLADDYGDQDPTVFGHVIVDEAQDVSPMQWRMIGRRVPSGSMTIVGDLGQASRPAAVKSWQDVVDQLPTRREPRLLELTVNYRTPAEIMVIAAAVLAITDPQLEPPTSVRSSGHQPRFYRTDSPATLAIEAAIRTAEIRSELGDGKIAVVVSPGQIVATREALSSTVPDLRVGEGPDSLDADVALLTPAQTKGLEFDAVVLVEPVALAGDDPAGLRGLYVALTRATRLLTVVSHDDLPDVLSSFVNSGA